MNIHKIMTQAHSLQASDIHLTANSPIIYRIHGILKPATDEVLKPIDTHEYVRELMTTEQYEAFIEKGDADFSYGIEGLCRFRVNVYRQRGCVGLAIRLIPSHIPLMQELRLPRITQDFAMRPQGLVLVTGPTGSGKSTTLASMIDFLNRTEKNHIITLEDPIEFIYENQLSIVNQREIGLDTFSFANGLRAALRQDPDVILVGEMRDLETISTAITAAETGHLVFATLHTADAPQTIDRIIDVFPTEMQGQIRVQLASVLVGIIAQRLLLKKDGSGRVAAHEILVNTPAVANLIRTEKIFQIRSVMQTGRAFGMQTLDLALRELVQQGVVSMDEARSSTNLFSELEL